MRSTPRNAGHAVSAVAPELATTCDEALARPDPAGRGSCRLGRDLAPGEQEGCVCLGWLQGTDSSGRALEPSHRVYRSPGALAHSLQGQRFKLPRYYESECTFLALLAVSKMTDHMQHMHEHRSMRPMASKASRCHWG